jgi:hypothetical protein
MEYDNMDFNDEEQAYHNRRVTFVKDSILTSLQPYIHDGSKLDWKRYAELFNEGNYILDSVNENY